MKVKQSEQIIEKKIIKTFNHNESTYIVKYIHMIHMCTNK
jgi:hypothetical protein